MPERRVLVVEDEALLRDLLVDVCSRGGFESCGARTAVEANGLVDRFDPDLVVLDVDLGDGPSGADLGRALERRRPDVALLYLTRLSDLRAAGYTSTPGATVGFVRKDSILSADDFLGCVEAMFSAGGVERRDDLDPRRPLARLTDVQHDVLRLASLGLSNRAIAERRSTSESAVEAHLTAIFRALGVQGSMAVNRRAEAIRRYVEAAGRPIDPNRLAPQLGSSRRSRSR